MTSSDELAPRLKCPFDGCTLVFTKYIPFKKHKRSHVNLEKKQEHKCAICNAVFNRPWRLERHFRSHTGERPFTCDAEGCSKSYTNQCHLKRHKKVSHEKNPTTKKLEFLCGELNCGKVFETKFGLKRHIMRNHSREARVYTCKECNVQFRKRNKLQAHMGIHGQKKSDEYRCSQCSLSFSTEVMLSRHSKNHRIYTCDCKEIFQRWSELCSHRKNNCTFKKEHKCIICSKMFVTKHNLTQHSLTHIEESKQDIFKCPYSKCSRSYKYKKNLTFHIGVAHEEKIEEQSDVAKFKCHIGGCGLLFKSKKTLTEHRRSVHLDLPKKERKPKNERRNKMNTSIDWATAISRSDTVKSTTTLESTNKSIEIDQIFDEKQMLSTAPFKRVLSVNTEKISDLKNDVVNFKPGRKIAPLGSGVVSRKRKANERENDNIPQEILKNKSVAHGESDIESDAPSEVLLLEADKVLDNINNILSPDLPNTDEDNNVKNNVDIDLSEAEKCSKNNTDLFLESFINSSTDNDHLINKVGASSVLNDERSFGLKLKPLKIMLETMDFSKRGREIYFHTQNTDSKIENCFKHKEKLAQAKMKSLKVVLERMPMQSQQFSDSDLDSSSNCLLISEQNLLDGTKNLEMESLVSSVSEEMPFIEMKKDKSNSEVVESMDESVDVPRINIINVQVLKNENQHAVPNIVDTTKSFQESNNNCFDLSNGKLTDEPDSYNISRGQPVDLVKQAPDAIDNISAELISVDTETFTKQNNSLNSTKHNEISEVQAIASCHYLKDSKEFENLVDLSGELSIVEHTTNSTENIVFESVTGNNETTRKLHKALGTEEIIPQSSPINVCLSLGEVSECKVSENDVDINEPSNSSAQAVNTMKNISIELVSVDSETTSSEHRNALDSSEIPEVQTIDFCLNFRELSECQKSENFVYITEALDTLPQAGNSTDNICVEWVSVEGENTSEPCMQADDSLNLEKVSHCKSEPLQVLEQKSSVDPVPVGNEIASNHDYAMDRIKNILKSLSPDNSIVEDALDKIKGILNVDSYAKSDNNR